MKKVLLSIFFSIALLSWQILAPYAIYAELPERPDTPELTESADEAEIPSDPDYPDNFNENEEGPPTEDDEASDSEVSLREKKNNNQKGDPKITTGDVNANGTIQNTGNLNQSDIDGSGIDDITILNQDNGTDSDNSAILAIDNSDETTQDNSANLQNNLEIDAETGGNSASENTAADSSIQTGDATATGVIINNVNTNAVGGLISEFNIHDDYVGDLTLENISNGASSENTTAIDFSDSSTTFQTNDGTLENNLILTANTGDNKTDNNTGGNNTIETGDANASASVLNLINNNFAGSVFYNVVNIFGDYVGDILIPEQYSNQLPPDININNSDNGSDSKNTGEVFFESFDEITQLNDIEIINNLDLDATTGSNKTSDNTGGDNSITTGDSDIDVNVINIANNNFVGGNWWFVLVNQAGNWVGKIFTLSGSSNDNYAGTNTDIAVKNQDNGSLSVNTGTVSVSDIDTTTQINNGKIVNNLTLDSNTGGNSASRNTGGNSEITTGDASSVVNLINFANNNFVGGNVFLTVINVMGSWLGDVIGPGVTKPEEPVNLTDNNLGGTSNQTPVPNNSSENNSTGGSSNSSSTSSSSSSVLSSTTQTPHPVAGDLQASAGLSDVEDFIPFTAQQNSANKVKINLAWALWILPIGSVLLLNKKYKLLSRFLTRS